MSSEAYAGSKSHRSEDHRRERRHRTRHDDNDSGGRDRDRDRNREDTGGSRDRRRERDRRKESKKRSRDDERREHSRSRRHSDSDSEDDDKRRRRDSRREKSSSKRRKKSSRRSSRHSDSDSEYSSDYDRKRSNDKRKKKKKSSKSHSRPEKKDKKSAKTLKKPDKSKLVPMGEPVGKPPDTRVNAEEDYFSYYQEFQIYLFREEGTCFNDIDTEDARAAFARFANEYNAGRLEEPYYSRTFSHEVIEESKTTKHSWGFKTTNAERRGLGDLQKGIRRQTEYNNNKTKEQQNPSINIRNLSSVRSSEVSCPPVESLGSASASARRQRPTPEERLKERRADRRLKEHVRLTQEELTGGPKDGRERRLEQKREHSARIHGAHRDQEGAAAGMELSDAALFGDDDGRAILGRSRQKKERRDERQKNRIQELQAKEEEKKKNMLKMLGLENLQGQKKIEIAPRK